MKKLIAYICDSTPKDEEIMSAIEIAKREDCFVRLEWFVKYNGWHSIIIDKDSFFETVRNKLPKCYGI